MHWTFSSANRWVSVYEPNTLFPFCVYGMVMYEKAHDVYISLLWAYLWFSERTVRAPWLLKLCFPELFQVLRHWITSKLANSYRCLQYSKHWTWYFICIIIHAHNCELSSIIILILQLEKTAHQLFGNRVRIQTQVYLAPKPFIAHHLLMPTAKA